MPSTPPAIWSAVSSRRAGSSTSPSRNGVTRAVKTPSTTALPPDPAGEDLDRRPRHVDGRVPAGPGDLELASAQLDHDLPVHPALEHGYHGDGAGTAPAGQGLAGAALPGALADAPPALRGGELDVDAVREGRMVLDQRPEPLHRRPVGILDEDHGVRVAHRDRGDPELLAVDLEQVAEHRARARAERGRDLRRLEDGAPHLDADPPRARPARAHHAGEGLDPDLVLRRVTPVPQELEEAADPVGAHLHLGAVGVVDLHAEVGAPGGPDDEQLVRPDPEVPVAQAGRDRADRRQLLADAVEHDEVVARAVHLREVERARRLALHDRSSSGTVSPRTRSSCVSRARTTAKRSPRTSTSAARGRPLELPALAKP